MDLGYTEFGVREAMNLETTGCIGSMRWMRFPFLFSQCWMDKACDTVSDSPEEQKPDWNPFNTIIKQPLRYVRSRVGGPVEAPGPTLPFPSNEPASHAPSGAPRSRGFYLFWSHRFHDWKIAHRLSDQGRPELRSNIVHDGLDKGGSTRGSRSDKVIQGADLRAPPKSFPPGGRHQTLRHSFGLAEAATLGRLVEMPLFGMVWKEDSRHSKRWWQTLQALAIMDPPKTPTCTWIFQWVTNPLTDLVCSIFHVHWMIRRSIGLFPWTCLPTSRLLRLSTPFSPRTLRFRRFHPGACTAYLDRGGMLRRGLTGA